MTVDALALASLPRVSTSLRTARVISRIAPTVPIHPTVGWTRNSAAMKIGDHGASSSGMIAGPPRKPRTVPRSRQACDPVAASLRTDAWKAADSTGIWSLSSSHTPIRPSIPRRTPSSAAETASATMTMRVSMTRVSPLRLGRTVS